MYYLSEKQVGDFTISLVRDRKEEYLLIIQSNEPWAGSPVKAYAGIYGYYFDPIHNSSAIEDFEDDEEALDWFYQLQAYEVRDLFDMWTRYYESR